MKGLLFTLLLLFIIIQSNAQTRADSLLTLFNTDKASIEECIELATLYNETNPDSGNYFAKIALKYAKAADNNIQIGEAYYQIADSYYFRDKYDSTLIFYRKSLDYYLRTKENNEIAGVANDIGQVLQQLSKLDSSMVYFQMALQYIDKESLPAGYYAIAINIANTHTYLGEYAYSNETLLGILNDGVDYLSATYRGVLLNNIGLNYRRASNYEKAILYYNKARIIDDSLNNNKRLITDYMNIANVYFSWKKYDEALRLFHKANDISYKLKLPRDIASSCADIGSAYKAMGEYKLAEKYLNIAAESALVSNDKYLIAIVMHDKAGLAFHQEDYRKSIALELEAIEIYKQLKRNYPLTNAYLSLGKSYKAIEDYNIAEVNLKKADSLSKLIASAELEEDAALQLAMLYSSVGNNALSNNYYQNFIKLNDSIFSIKSHNILTEYQVKYDNLEKQRAVERISLENELNIEKIGRKNKLIWVLSASAILFLIMGLILWSLYNQKKRSYQLLFDKNKAQLITDKQAAACRRDMMKNNVPTEISDKILSALYKALDDEKVFLQQDLSASKLAEHLNTNTSYLSKIINDKFELNYNALINKYRIQEAQIIILQKDYKNYTIEAIAHESGYKSKSTFNEAFKRITGLTPSYYLANKMKLE